MRIAKVTLLAGLMLCVGFAAQAELQNVLVGGSIRIRGNWYDYDESLSYGDETTYFEQRTTLNVRADFTEEVSAFIELDSYDFWGEGDFRSNYLTGADGRGGAGVDVYQAYIQASEMWGTALQMRVGRQELVFGSEWLAGNNNTASLYRGLSHDGIRLGYATDMFSIDGFWTKVADDFTDLGDDDVDFMGIYASYTGLEDIVIDGYWMFVRDDGNSTVGVAPLGFDDASIHTFGLRGAGTYGAFDFEAEVAYQWGDVDDDDFTFWFIDFDDDFEYSALGANVELGYTFDANMQPRIFIGGAYFEGGDDDDSDWWRWWDDNEQELAFNRLFSDWEYSEFLANTELSNVVIVRGGVSFMPTESVALALVASYFWADETDGRDFLWWSWDEEDNLGLEVGIYADYQYTEDLVFRAGYAHFFTDDGVEDGNEVLFNGLIPLVSDDDDYDYIFLETELSF